MVKKTVLILFSLFASCTLLGSLDNPKPKIFVIGDSISIHYGPFLKKSVEGFFEYDRKRDGGQALKDLDNPIGANGGDSNMVLKYLKKLRDSSQFHTDYLVINCGLHDIKTKPATGEIQVPIAQYKNNLDSIIILSKAMDVKLIWINTTPVVDTVHNRKARFHRYSKDVLRYNETAEHRMLQNGVPIIDLFTFTKKFIPEGYNDHVHFQHAIREKQADFIAGNLVRINAND